MRAVQLPYQAVIQHDRMLSIVRVLGAKPNFFSLLRLKRRSCAFFTTLPVWVDHFRSSVMCTCNGCETASLVSGALNSVSIGDVTCSETLK